MHALIRLVKRVDLPVPGPWLDRKLTKIETRDGVLILGVLHGLNRQPQMATKLAERQPLTVIAIVIGM